MADPELHDLLIMVGELKQQINKLDVDLTYANSKLRNIDRALGYMTVTRPTWVRLKYDHRNSELVFNETLRIRFDKNEAALLALLFYAKTGSPKKKKFYCVEVAEHFTKIDGGPKTAKTVHQTLVRIDEKVRLKTNLDAFFITTQEFHNLSR